MDVIFFENRSFFDKSQTSIQKETEIEESLFNLPYQNPPPSELPLEELAKHESPSSELLTSSGIFFNTPNHEQEEQYRGETREAAQERVRIENLLWKIYT
jgi:hypothetical protein